ncbi:MAG: hypothetical protein IJD91_09320 [Clostridia bacterium]|nr:hypothetical protein [Clostridia bacterium]
MDLEQEISKALSDPDIMNKVQGVLSSLSENNNEEKEGGEVKLPNNMLSALSKSGGDDRTRLLLALKPFLSEKRAPYMDSAVTILRLASMGKLGKDLNLF